jgi:hypothetical protein
MHVCGMWKTFRSCFKISLTPSSWPFDTYANDIETWHVKLFNIIWLNWRIQFENQSIQISVLWGWRLKKTIRNCWNCTFERVWHKIRWGLDKMCILKMFWNKILELWIHQIVSSAKINVFESSSTKNQCFQVPKKTVFSISPTKKNQCFFPLVHKKSVFKSPKNGVFKYLPKKSVFSNISQKTMFSKPILKNSVFKF